MYFYQTSKCRLGPSKHIRIRKLSSLKMRCSVVSNLNQQLHSGCVRLTLFRNKNKRNKPKQPFDGDASPIPQYMECIPNILVQNNDVNPSSHSRVFETTTKNCGCLWQTKGLGTTFGKISCKENVQRQKELRKFCRCRSRSPNYSTILKTE